MGFEVGPESIAHQVREKKLLRETRSPTVAAGGRRGTIGAESLDAPIASVHRA